MADGGKAEIRYNNTILLGQSIDRLLAIHADAKADTGIDSNETLSIQSGTEPEDSDDKLEEELCANLVQAGGRPCYPVEMLDYARRNPKLCRQVLQPWVNYVPAGPRGWKVLLFERQLSY
ncbi:hypothetical protein PG993_003098 [Apiospora rasikravindrae]|uniref:Uncharacterized protein n=1 Tax=Apiospora rasikravindrae TaxID=990691 RepID=A0ABR1TYQ8_9PEZI